MRAGNARTSVKPGRREETRSVGYAVRPRRLPPTLPPPDPRWRRWLGANSAISRPGASLRPPRAERPRRRRGRARCGAATLGPAHTTSPRPALVVGRASRRRRQRPARRACVEERVWPGPSPSSCRASDSLVARSAKAATAGPASLIEQNQPTGVTTRCGLRCLAGLRQRLDAVACLCISSTRAYGVPLGSRQLAIEA